MRFILLLLIGMLFFTACSEDSDSNGSDALTKVELSFTGLEILNNGFHYEGWVMLNGAPVTTGKFNITESGGFVDVNGKEISNQFSTPNNDDLTKAAAFILTIEPNGDTDSNPASTKIIAGDFTNNTTSLSVKHSAALGNDFMASTGNYILATPTTTTMSDENSGIWFLDFNNGSPITGLDLPILPDGWVYEGWAVINGTPVTSGRFTDLDKADLAAPFSSNENAGPPFPGEDYIQNAPAGLTFPTNLAGGKAVISIEPHPDNSPAPFTLKPLVGDIAANATDHTTYSMGNNAMAFPTGSATIK